MRISRKDFDDLVRQVKVANRNLFELTQVVANNRRIIQNLINQVFLPDERYGIGDIEEFQRCWGEPFGPDSPGFEGGNPLSDWSLYGRAPSEMTPVKVASMYNNVIRSERAP